MNALELFCGCGGFALGLAQAGVTIDLAIDNNPVAVQTYNRNHSPVAEVADLNTWIPSETPGSYDLVVGSPPCQGFSTQGNRDPRDPRNSLVMEYLRVVCHLVPRYFILENVSGLHHKTNHELYDLLRRCFSDAGYRLVEWRLDASQYGVPQKRKRVFLIGTRGHLLPQYPTPLDTLVTTGKALGHPYDSDTTGMEVAHHAEGTVVRYANTLPGTKEPVSWFPRLDPQQPSPTITASGRFIHPTEPRILTVRECARLQGFPDWFVFPDSKADAYRLIGNAVPPALGYHVGKAVFDSLRKL